MVAPVVTLPSIGTVAERKKHQRTRPAEAGPTSRQELDTGCDCSPVVIRPGGDLADDVADRMS
jgi:hypothetical protein